MSIPTPYRGYLFRSRLEAKWAKFFDLCDWKWSYEPTDLPGWIPDFEVGDRRTPVEIKPLASVEEFWRPIVLKDRIDPPAIPKIIASGWRDPVILLGKDATFSDGTYCDGPNIGWLMEFDGPEVVTWDLHFGTTIGNGKFGLCPMDGPWRNAVWKIDGKPGRIWLERENIEHYLVQKWAAACNESQWVPLREESAA